MKPGGYVFFWSIYMRTSIFGKWGEVRRNLPLVSSIHFIATLGKLFLSFILKTQLLE